MLHALKNQNHDYALGHTSFLQHEQSTCKAPDALALYEREAWRL